MWLEQRLYRMHVLYYGGIIFVRPVKLPCQELPERRAIEHLFAELRPNRDKREEPIKEMRD